MSNATVGGRMRGFFLRYLLALTVLWVIVLNVMDLPPKEGELIPPRRGDRQPRPTGFSRSCGSRSAGTPAHWSPSASSGGWPMSCTTWRTAPNGVSDGEDGGTRPALAESPPGAS